jgi:RNA polymerase sigma-70 factor (ECF subfamily)
MYIDRRKEAPVLESDRAAAVQRAVQGDGDSLQRLLVHYHEALCAIVGRAMPAALMRTLDPEDVLQQAYTAAFESIGGCRFDGPGGFYKWLERIALDRLAVCRRDARRDKRDIRRVRPLGAGRAGQPSTSYLDLAKRLAAGSSTPSRHAMQRETVAVVVSSLARLTADQREVIRLRILEGRTAAETASRLDKTEPAVHMLTHRGLKALRRLMDSAGAF